MPLNQKLCVQLLCRLGRLNRRELLLELREEVLARRHQVGHVACTVLGCDSPTCRGDAYLESPMRRCSSLRPSRPALCGIPMVGLTLG
jgi:hypothetical protein